MYGYNPYYQPYQQRLAQLEQQPIYQPPVQPLQATQNASILKGRIVSSIDEAKASQVDFDGSITYFACPAEQKIYAKSIGLNGLPVFLTYALSEEKSTKNEEQNLTNSVLVRLDNIEEKVQELYDELTTNVTAGQ